MSREMIRKCESRRSASGPRNPDGPRWALIVLAGGLFLSLSWGWPGLPPAAGSGVSTAFAQEPAVEESPAPSAWSEPVLEDGFDRSPEAGENVAPDEPVSVRRVAVRPLAASVDGPPAGRISADQTPADQTPVDRMPVDQMLDPPQWAWAPYTHVFLVSFGFVLGFALAAGSVFLLSRWYERQRGSFPVAARLEAPLRTFAAVLTPALKPPAFAEADPVGRPEDGGPAADERPWEREFSLLRDMLGQIEKKMTVIDTVFTTVGDKLEAAGLLREQLENQVTRAGEPKRDLSGREPEARREPGAGQETPSLPPVPASPAPGSRDEVGPAPASGPEEPFRSSFDDDVDLRPAPGEGSDGEPLTDDEYAIEAETTLERSRRAAEDTVRHTLARSLRAAGNQLLAEGAPAEAVAKYEEALGLMRELAAGDPGNLTWRRDLVLAYHNLGRALEAMDRLEAALEQFQEALKLTAGSDDRKTDNLDWHRGLAASHSHVGRLKLALGRLTEAGIHYENDLTIMTRLAERQPDNRAWQYALAGSLRNFGLVLEKMGWPDEALDKYRREMTIMQKLADLEPDNNLYLHDLAGLRGQMGRLLKKKGRFKEAQAQARGYLHLMRKLVHREPDNHDWRRELSLALDLTGRLLEREGHYEQAKASYEAALEIRRELLALGPESVVWQCDVANGLCKIGDICLARRQWDDARKYYLEALEIVEAVEKTAVRPGEEAVCLTEKCGILMRLGNLDKDRDAVSAFEYYNQALAITAGRTREGDGADWAEMEATIKRNMTGAPSG